MNDNPDTIMIKKAAESCETEEDLRVLLSHFDDYYINWNRFINRILDESGLSYNQFALLCGISKNTVKKWCLSGGVPRSRDTFIKLGFGLKMNLNEINRLLTRFGGYQSLNPKDLYDAACIFTLSMAKKNTGKYDYAYAQELYQKCVCEEDNNESVILETIEAMQRIQTLVSEEEFLDFTAKYKSIMSGKKQKLEQYITDFIKIRINEFACQEDNKVSWHSYIRSLGISGEFEKIVSRLHTNGTIPRRERLVALGLHLGMTLDEINKMLHYAGMEPLYAKDKLECVLIYALQKLNLLHPEYPLGNAEQILAVTENPEIKQECMNLIDEYMKASYKSEDDDWGELSSYIRMILNEIDIDEAEEILHLL